MPLFRRRPAHLPLVPPRLDGTGWPDPAEVGRPSFEANTLYEVATRHACESEAQAIGSGLVDAVLPHVRTGAPPQDEPYLHNVFTVAARIGAGLGVVERGLGTPDSSLVDRRVAAALVQAGRKLPVMRRDWAHLAGYFLRAGHYVARTDLFVMPLLVEELGPAGPRL